MATVILFIYLHYLKTIGYNTSVFDYICLFLLGAIQVSAWFVKIGLFTRAIEGKEESTPKRLDEWLK